MKKILIFVFVLLTVSVIGASASMVPEVLPALQNWDVAEGSFMVDGTTTVYVGDESLKDTAEIFISDAAPIVGNLSLSEEQVGSICLMLTEEAMKTDGYVLTISPERVVIEAPTVAGVFYGTQTLLQMLHADHVLPAGKATDWADMTERASMIDIGRKYYTIGWLKCHIRRMAYYKMNFLHLHLTDNEGWHIQCDTYPAIVTEPHYTKDEMRDIIAYAAKYHIEIIPEIDMPGHMKPVASVFTHLALPGTNYKLDLSNPDVYAFVRNLLNEYCDLFPGRYFHCGMDEYLTASEYPNYPHLSQYAQQHFGTSDGQVVYYHFINFANEIVNSKGKIMRMWNDGLYENAMSIVPKNVVLDVWFVHPGALSAKQLIERGFKVANCNTSFLYYVLGVDWASPNAKTFHERWRADIFVNYDYNNITDQIVGAKHQVWADVPGAETEASVNISIREIIASFAEKTWNMGHKSSFQDFTGRMLMAGDPPGWGLEPYSIEGNGIAKGCSVTASHAYAPNGWTADKIVDGDTNTRWSSEGTGDTGATVVFDLGTKYHLSGMKILWETAYATHYDIAVSEDGDTWTTVRTKTNSGGGMDIFNGGLGVGRYVKLILKQSSYYTNYSIYEAWIFGKPVGKNIAEGMPVKASAEFCSTSLIATADQVNDGDENTRWSAEPGNLVNNHASVTIALDHTAAIDSVLLFWENAFASAYTLSVSDNGTDWKEIYRTTGGDGAVDALADLNATGSYLKLDMTARGTEFGYSIYEIYVFEKAKAAIEDMHVGEDIFGIQFWAQDDAVCLMAYYDEDGRLISAQTRYPKKGTSQLAFEKNNRAASYALYTWDGMGEIRPLLSKSEALYIASLEKEPFLKNLPEVYTAAYHNDFNNATASDIYTMWYSPILNPYTTPVVNGELKACWNIGAGETVGYVFARSLKNARYEMKIRVADSTGHCALTLRNGKDEALVSGNMYGDYNVEQGGGLGIVVADSDAPNKLRIIAANAAGEPFSDAAIFDLNLPEGVSFTEGATLTVYDLYDRVMIYVNDLPVATVRVTGDQAAYSDYGAVFNGEGNFVGSFEKMLYREGHLSLTERARDFYIDDLKIDILK